MDEDFKRLRLGDPGVAQVLHVDSNSSQIIAAVHNPLDKKIIHSLQIHLHVPGADGGADIDRDYVLVPQRSRQGLPPLMDDTFSFDVGLPEATVKRGTITFTKAWGGES